MGNKGPVGEVKTWTVKVEHLDATNPDDEVEWGETEICENWGGHKGFTLANLTKTPKVEPSE